MRTWKVPVTFRRMDGFAADCVHDYAHPFIDIDLSLDHDAQSGQWVRTRALIDTGSTYTMLRLDVLKALGAKKVKSLDMAGNFSRKDTDFYQVHMRAVGAEVFTLAVEAGELDVPFEDGEALALVGMDYLRFGRTTIEGPVGDSFFELMESRIRLAEATARPV